MKSSLSILRVSIILSFLFLFNGISFSQQLTIPMASQKASVSQRIGLTDITIDYHRPGVKGRQIWEKLVPYNEVWRAGANENTTISFTDPVIIEGKDIAAGKYGLHMIPTENDWTIIFSKNNWSWGSFFYDPEDDALRVNVKPESADFQEWLSYSFEEPSSNSVTAVLHWEKLKIPIKIQIDVKKVVLDHFKKELDNLQGFSWQAWNQAAAYCLFNDYNFDQSIKWSDRSISINKNGSNLWIKSILMDRTGNKQESENLKNEALEIATEAEINTLGYQFLFANHVDDAIELFEKNIKAHPDSWNVYDSLGEALAVKGDKQNALKNYEKALNMVKDDQNKKRIKSILNDLKSD